MDQEQQIYEAQLVTSVIHQKEPRRMLNEYAVHEELGQGSFGKVKRVTRYFKEDEDSEIEQLDYAMKIFNRSVLSHQRTCYYEHDAKEPKMTTMLEFALNEINIWKYLNNGNVCKLYQIMDDEDDAKDCIYLIMQLGDLGCLMDFDEYECRYVRSDKIMTYLNRSLEQSAQVIFKQVAMGIQYLHSNGIVNRDIKVDNIIGSSKYTFEESFKIIDFSTARYAEVDSIFYDCAGTSGYRAPEVQFSLNNGYNPFPLDIWSFGICLYTFMHEKVYQINNQLPFYGECELEIDVKARDNEIQMHVGSESLRDLISQCCHKNPALRPTISQVLKHVWFN